MLDLNIFGLDDAQIKELTKDLSYMLNPMSKFYLRKNLRLEESTEGTMEYDHSPYSALFITTPDCTSIIVPGEDVDFDTKVKKIDPIDDEVKKNIKDNFLRKDNDLFSIPVGIRKQLVLGENNPFIPMITNFFDDSSFDIPDISLDTVDVGENRFGIRQTLPRYTYQSQVGQNFNLSFTDVSFHDKAGSMYYGKLILMNLHKAWVHYINAVRVGSLHPGDMYSLNLENYGDMLEATSKINYKEAIPASNGQPAVPAVNGRDSKGRIIADRTTGKILVETQSQARLLALMKMKRVINYVASAYYFKLAPDGKTVTYWCKYSGIFPKSYGNSALSGSNRELTKISIDFQSQWFEDGKLSILDQFNVTSLGESSRMVKAYKDYPDGFVPFDEGVNIPAPKLMTALQRTGNPYLYVENGSLKLEVGKK